jgi:hypothetical protein
MLLALLFACDPDVIELPEPPEDTGEVAVETDTETVPDNEDTSGRDTADTEDTPSDEETEAKYQAFYNPAVVQVIELELSRDAMQDLRRDPFTYVEGGVTINGERFDTVGIRLKGSSSYQDFDGKPAFKIKLNNYVPGQKYAGLERVTLNNMVGDPTQSKEMIGYALWTERGLLVPRVSYARVSLNGELQGLYTNLEAMDDHLLARHYGDGSGDLWEGNDSADFSRRGLSHFELVSGVGDYDALDTVKQTLNGAPADAFLEEADTVIDMDSFLDFWAYSIAIGNEDGYPYNLNDYFVYRDVGDTRFDFAPWGMDESWDTGMVWNAVTGNVAEGCLDDEDCVTALYEHTAEAVLAYEAMDLESWALGVWDLSDPIVEEDLRRPYSTAEVLAARATLLTQITVWPSRVRRQMGLPAR